VNVFTRDSRTGSPTDSRISRPPKFAPCQLEVPSFCMFATPRLHRITILELHTFANSRLRRFQASENRKFPVPEKHVSRTLLSPDVSRVTGFPEFPNTSPSGKRVDSDDRIPRIFRKFSKKRHPRNVGGNTRRPETLKRLNRGRFRGTTPPRLYNRRLPLLKNFTALLLFTIRESFCSQNLVFY
jgi:hypothetical protein